MLPHHPAAGHKPPLTKISLFQCRRGSLEVVGKSTVTGRYQLTLPKHAREFLGAEKGDLIVFIKDHDEILVKRGTVKIDE